MLARMAARLGFFGNFKGADTVLLTAAPAGRRRVARSLRRFAASSRPCLPVPAIPIPGRKARLCVVRGLRESLGKPNALARSRSGHHCFELSGFRVQLLVSVGE